MIYLSTLLISMFTTIVLIPIFMGLAVKLKALDVPNERKVHQIPTPKSGGISMTLGALVPVLLWMPKNNFTLALLIGAWIIVLFGLIDDFMDIDYKIKFCGQLVAALIVVVYGGLKIKSMGALLMPGYELPDFLAMPLTIFVIVGVTNAINLSDGLDGLAGGICMLSFLFIGYLAFVENNRAIAIFSIALIGAIVGFLRYNTFPASIFMGDAGSQLLGFLLITTSLHLTQNSVQLSPILPLLIIGLPVLDTLVVMLERLMEGGSPFRPDQKHLHHKLLRLGFYHTESVLTIYVLHALLLTAGFILRDKPDWLLLMLYLVYVLGIILLLNVMEKRQWKRATDQKILDRQIKGRLRILKERHIIIQFGFKTITVGIPALFIIACFIPRQIPAYISLFSFALMVTILISWLRKRSWNSNLMRVSLYLLIPFLIFFGEKNTGPWINDIFLRSYNYAYIVIVFFVILTLRLTRRKGFKATPMDFLILFIALIIPNLPDAQIKSYQMGWVASKIIALYFSFEVLNGELRGELNKLIIPVLGAMGIISLRGFLGI
jgi:UDP-GlcNAc:undecaprenyl-phosphate GlcNAc-1-phosphate transferase